MKKFILSILILSGICSYAQNSNTSIGIRGGYHSGISVKHFIESNKAIEGIISFRRGGAIVTALYQVQHDFDARGFSWHYGAGAHIGLWNQVYKKEEEDNLHLTLGADLIAGLEYEFNEIPFEAALDVLISMNAVGGGYFSGIGPAVSLRYCF